MKDKITRTVALYSSKYLENRVHQVSGWIIKDEDYIQTSEPREIEFTPLPDEVILKGRVASIDAEIEKTRAEMSLKINNRVDQKQRFLCITNGSESAG